MDNGFGAPKIEIIEGIPYESFKIGIEFIIEI